MGRIKTELDYLTDVSYIRTGCVVVRIEKAKRAARIARMRGMMKAYKDSGCIGSYEIIKGQLDSLLKNINNDKYKFN